MRAASEIDARVLARCESPMCLRLAGQVARDLHQLVALALHAGDHLLGAGLGLVGHVVDRLGLPRDLAFDFLQPRQGLFERVVERGDLAAHASCASCARGVLGAAFGIHQPVGGVREAARFGARARAVARGQAGEPRHHRRQQQRRGDRAASQRRSGDAARSAPISATAAGQAADDPEPRHTTSASNADHRAGIARDGRRQASGVRHGSTRSRGKDARSHRARYASTETKQVRPFKGERARNAS